LKLLDRIHPFALLALRVVLGAIMLANALPYGVGGIGTEAHSILQQGWMAALIWAIELVSGSALVLGAATRVFASALLIDMLVRILKLNTFQLGNSEFEQGLALAAMAFAVAILGAGPISMDWLFARKEGF
jgi:uncharacterized membrane protein YphA (DoxX/SURF4 family)